MSDIKEQAVESVIAKQKRDCARRYLSDIRKMRIRLELSALASENGYGDLMPSGIAYDDVRVKTSPTGDRLERGVIKLMERREDATSFADAVAPAIEDAKRLVRELDDMEERYVLFARYFHGRTPVEFRQIADELGYEVRTVYRKHDAALEHMYDRIPGDYKMSKETKEFLDGQREAARYE